MPGTKFRPSSSCELVHERVGVLFLFRVVGLRLGFLRAPAAVAVVTAIVGIPAQHIPQFRPIEQILCIAIAGKKAGNQEPRHGIAARLLMFSLELFWRQNFEMRQQFFHVRDALTRGTGMAALAAVITSFACEAVIRAKGDGHRSPAS